MAEAEVHLLEQIHVAPAARTPVFGAPHHFFDDLAWLFMDSFERLFFYPPRRPGHRVPAAFLPDVLPRFFRLAGTILSPAARCFSYSNGHDALDLVLAVLMEDFNWLEYEITPPLLNQDGSSLSIH